jgi:hypothetical protein
VIGATRRTRWPGGQLFRLALDLIPRGVELEDDGPRVASAKLLRQVFERTEQLRLRPDGFAHKGALVNGCLQGASEGLAFLGDPPGELIVEVLAAPLRLVLGGLRDRADWPTLRETLIAWGEGGFNLLRAAERLHVHRNTLLYRLGKIEHLSARQMREPTQAVAMYLTALADLLDSPAGKIRATS